MDSIRSGQSQKVSGSSSSSNKTVGRFSTFVDGTPIVKAESGHVALIGNKKMKAVIAGLRVGDEIEVRGRKTSVPKTGEFDYSGPAIAVTDIKVTRRAPQAQGVFSQFVDGTFVVKTSDGLVGIGAPTPEIKKKLASLTVGDVIEVFGRKTTIPQTGSDAFSGPMIMASEIRVKSRAPAPQKFVGDVMHLGAQPGYPSGPFLRLNQPVTINGKSFTMISLPGRFSSDIGDKLALEGFVEIAKSPAGVEYLHFSSPPTVMVDRAPQRDEFLG